MTRRESGKELPGSGWYYGKKKPAREQKIAMEIKVSGYSTAEYSEEKRSSQSRYMADWAQFVTGELKKGAGVDRCHALRR